MVKPKIFVSCLLAVGLLAYSTWVFVQPSYPTELSLTRDDQKMSYIDVLVHGEERSALIDLGSRFIRADRESIRKGYTRPTGKKGVSHTLLAPPIKEKILILDNLKLGSFFLKDIEVRPPSIIRGKSEMMKSSS